MLATETIAKVLQQLNKLTQIHKNKSLENIYISLAAHDTKTIQNISLCIKSFETAISSLDSILSQIGTTESLNKPNIIAALENLEIAINFYKKQYFLINNLDYDIITNASQLKEYQSFTEDVNKNIATYQKAINEKTSAFDELFQEIKSNKIPVIEHKIDTCSEKINNLAKSAQELNVQFYSHSLSGHFAKEANKLKYTHPNDKFYKRFKYLTSPYHVWLIFTFLGMIGIFYLSYYLAFVCQVTDYKNLITYSPMLMVLVWFTWFSSKQFSYIKQLHDEYEYKTVLSSSYIVYKNTVEDATDASKEATLLLLKYVLANIATSPVQSVKPDVHTPFSEIINTVSKLPTKSNSEPK